MDIDFPLNERSFPDVGENQVEFESADISDIMPKSSETYVVKGKYSYQGRGNIQVGVLVLEGDVLRGQIMDTSSGCPRHDIEGKVIREDGKTTLHLKKKPVGTWIADITYVLVREGVDEKLDGKYEGEWDFGDQEVGTIGIGYDPEIGERAVIIPPTERKNYACLTLDSVI